MKKPFTPLILVLALFISLSGYSLPKLSSYPSAVSTIYLDFDGQVVNSWVWNAGNTINCAAPLLNDAQITEIFNRVSEDYRPFDINITTDEAVYLAAPLEQRIRVVVTSTSSWYGNVGGVAYVGSFTWGDDTPCFVFSDRLSNVTKAVAECCSHESGHTVGLSHQSKYDASCNLSNLYNDGVGTGEPAWAPIMGNSYNRNMTGWNNGPTPYGCSFVQDNLSIITTQNGFTYRADDFNDISDPTPVDYKNINIDGIITTNSDKDAFKLSLSKSANLHLDVKPYSVSSNNTGANLDVRIQLLNSAKTVIRTYDPSTSMSVAMDTILSAGDYYVVVDGIGNAYTNDYGSLGSYQMRGVAGLLPIRDVNLTGKATDSKHDLNWNIISDDPIKTVVVETSTDGVNFKSLNSFSSSNNKFEYTPFEKSDIYYRLKVTSVYNQTVYSNTIFLKGIKTATKAFNVSTLVKNDISINASTNYQYLLSNMNGQVVAKGNGVQGFNKLSIDTHSNGVYILQIISNNERQIERIIKQ
ncbi:T9SS type A sorting domain-containing protein [Ferruginibacter lapsinanis]|uniref:T9SS type A sorting domain-containing protein n=1 Tax=Ferruginibacter lapsinanis TaxID=563172 RepID=UPI001E58BA2C|nr:T9SS type A sorting domain-containing protein [Ferruginibacter lapsinanis]UEG50328.1 T9SS type A sorting domain-containing protein [Ferruginibacter lapsinanis]